MVAAMDMFSRGAQTGGLHNPMVTVRQILTAIQAQEDTLVDMAVAVGLRPKDGALINRVLRGHIAWSQTLVSALVDPDWHACQLIYNAPVDVPRGVQVFSPHAPRVCPVTGVWFVSSHGQKYVPGLSAAVKRAARRDLARARERYATEGDWGA
jgi:hypothetical protein